jgi:hypothetical protein
MIADQLIYNNQEWSGLDQLRHQPENYQLVLVMGDKSLISSASVRETLQKKFVSSHVAFLSTAGEIYNSQAHEGSLIAVALHFDHTPLQVVEKNIHDFSNSMELGKELADSLDKKDLSYVMALSCGSLVNGEDLIRGMTSVLGNEILITGGMAGDGDKFESTAVGCLSEPREGNVVVIGFYGKHLQVTSGVKSGWSFFGPERTVTESDKNILYSIDGENALELYKRYLGDFANQLPSSALFFPIAILSDDSDVPLVRTILSVDEKNGTMTFAGNIPKGARVRLMRTNTEQIINNAGMAGAEAFVRNPEGAFAWVVNCIGRKLVLGAMASNEIVSIRKNMKPDTLIAGFYSYGEFSRFFYPGKACELHNQTVVVTLFDEK